MYIVAISNEGAVMVSPTEVPYQDESMGMAHHFPCATQDEAIALCSQLNGSTGILPAELGGILQEPASALILMNQNLRDLITSIDATTEGTSDGLSVLNEVMVANHELSANAALLRHSTMIDKMDAIKQAIATMGTSVGELVTVMSGFAQSYADAHNTPVDPVVDVEPLP